MNINPSLQAYDERFERLYGFLHSYILNMRKVILQTSGLLANSRTVLTAYPSKLFFFLLRCINKIPIGNINAIKYGYSMQYTIGDKANLVGIFNASCLSIYAATGGEYR